MVDKEKLIKAFDKATKGILNALPMLIGVVLLVGLFKSFVTKEMLSSVFTGSMISDTFVGALMGSISAGNPLTSYIIGGELLKEGVSLFAVTAFLVSWVTVGLIQFPAEAKFFGKRFASLRNGISFVLSLILSIIVVLLLGVIT